MRNISSIIIVIGLCLGMFSGIAFAETSCPEGTVAYRNTRTGDVVCFQGSEDMSSSLESNNASVSDSVSDSAQALDQNSQNVNYHDDAAIVEEAYLSDEDIFIPPEYSEDERKVLMSRAIAQAHIDHDNDLNSHLKQGGWMLDLGFGLGKGIGFVYNTRLSAGYVFATEGDVSFSLSGDAVLNFEWDDFYSMSLTLTPMLTLSMFRSYFHMGLGFGFMMTNQEEVNRLAYFENGIYYLKREESVNTEFQFTIKPVLILQLFVTDHTYCGFGLEIPIAAPRNEEKVTAFVDVFFNTGFRFE